MRKPNRAARILGAGLLITALLAAGPASARGRDHGDGGSAGAVALAIGALVGLAVVGTAVASQPVVMAAPPAPAAYGPAYGAPPGYCYRDYDRAYVPCAAQPVPYYSQQGPQPGYQGY